MDAVLRFLDGRVEDVVRLLLGAGVRGAVTALALIVLWIIVRASVAHVPELGHAIADAIRDGVEQDPDPYRPGPIQGNVGPNGEAPGTPGAPGTVGPPPDPGDGTGAGGG